MSTLQDLEKRVEVIEKRNKKVELDKAWETSWVRKILLIIVTYVTISLFMWFIHIENPWINAIVPSIGFFLSTLTLPFVKQRWILKNT
jgi:hypothetical protein